MDGELVPSKEEALAAIHRKEKIRTKMYIVFLRQIQFTSFGQMFPKKEIFLLKLSRPTNHWNLPISYIIS